MSIGIVSELKSLHARPTAIFSSPSTVLSQTFLRANPVDVTLEQAHLHYIIESKKLREIEHGKQYQVFQGESCQLRVEIHHEFICYIWILAIEHQHKDISAFHVNLSQQWFSLFPGTMLNQTCLIFDKNCSEHLSRSTLNQVLGDNQLIGNYVENKSARVWTSYANDDVTEICYFYIEDFSLGPRRTGRLAQHIVEMENYRVLAGLSFTLAEEIIFELKNKETDLVSLTKRLADTEDNSADQALIDSLLALSVISEELRSRTAHRFSASLAYYNIFTDRLTDIDEDKILGYQSLSKFLTRSSLPTFRLVGSANERLNLFISRIDRATALLTTRIRIRTEAQNQAILQSANKQSRQQMVLQETVEAFSIIAITYYACSLVKYGLVAVNKTGISVDAGFWLGGSIPLVFTTTYMTMRFIRRRKLNRP